MNEFKKDQRLRVRSDHPYHPNRVGYFSSLGEEAQVVVLADGLHEMCADFFAVKVSDIVEK